MERYAKVVIWCVDVIVNPLRGAPFRHVVCLDERPSIDDVKRIVSKVLAEHKLYGRVYTRISKMDVHVVIYDDGDDGEG